MLFCPNASVFVIYICFPYKLTVELESIPREMEALDRDIARAELLQAERLVVRLESDVKV